MARDPEVLAHQEWLGYLQPVGLVVSPAALTDAGAYIDRNVIDVQNRFMEWVKAVPLGGNEPVASVEDLRGLLCGVFGWRPSDFVGSPEAEPLPESLEVPLTDYQETLRPTYAVRGPAPQNPPADAASTPPWLMLIQILPTGQAFDEVVAVGALYTGVVRRHPRAGAGARLPNYLEQAIICLLTGEDGVLP